VIINITKIPLFYINLDNKPDRKNNMENMLKEYGFQNFERFSGVEAGKRVGCSTSHRNLLNHIIKNNIYPALILEDDLGIFDFRKNIECPDDADAMYLGFSRYGFNYNKDEPFPRSLKVKELGKNYHRVHNMLARHAIIHFNPEYDQACIDIMNKFINDPETHVAGDASIARIHPEYKIYCQNVPVFYQDDKGTRGLTKHSLLTCDFVELDKEV
jgi:hypothetical protein